MITAERLGSSPTKRLLEVASGCPVVSGHSCDISFYRNLVPLGQDCHKGGKCFREFVPEVRNAIACGIGIDVGYSKKGNPTGEGVEFFRVAIEIAYRDN